VLRYFEEVLKNLHNLEVFDAEDLTEWVNLRIAVVLY
jgi:hypothetical protein